MTVVPLLYNHQNSMVLPRLVQRKPPLLLPRQELVLAESALAVPPYDLDMQLAVRFHQNVFPLLLGLKLSLAER